MPDYDLMEENRIIGERLRRLGVELQIGFLILDTARDGMPIVYANEAFYRMSGYTLEEVIGKNGRFMHGNRTDQTVGTAIRECMQSSGSGVFEILNYHKNKRPFWNEITIQSMKEDTGERRFVLMLQRDITDRKRAEALVKLQSDIYVDIHKGHMISVLLDAICSVVESFLPSDAKCTVLFIDEEGKFRKASGRSFGAEFWRQIDGVPVSQDEGSCGASAILKKPIIVEDMKTDPLWASPRTAKVVKDFDLASSWSVPIFDKENEVVGTFAVYFNVRTVPTEDEVEFIQKISPMLSLTVDYYKQQQERLVLAYNDRETGLPNRNFFITELQDHLNKQREGAVIFLTVDEFAQVVDQYGHRVGDLLITEIAKRIEEAKLMKDAFFARFSDSTIGIVGITALDKVPRYLDDLARRFNEPIQLADMELFLSLKGGVALITPHQSDSEEIVRHADSALSNAKSTAGEVFCYYESEYDENMMRDLRIANKLTLAIRNEEISIHLQPKVDLKTGKILSFEALARWYSPELGYVPPNTFIPLAEKNGKIRVLEQSVLRLVLEWLKKRQDEGMELRQVAVNISADHFFHPTFVPNLINATMSFGIEPKWIRLEITERIGFVDIEKARNIFTQLNSYGFTSSVDDFGTGYSSLSYLQKLPVTEIKIDRSFITQLEDAGSLAIVRTIIQLAENLNMDAVAEGIETEEQRKVLEALGCRVGQGFLFYKPMPSAEANLLPLS